jgi:predicted PurR-regulated permease PerM
MQAIAGGVASLSLMLILSLYIMIDARRVSDQFYRLIPIRFQDDFQFIFSTFNRTFGAFLRGQLLMVVITIIFTGAVMRLFGLQFTMVTAILAGLAMFIPELGAPIALFAPSVASALQGSDATIPAILGEAMGMPPLLILVAVLVSAKVLGFWGFFFGVPLAGALYIIGVVSLERAKQTADAYHQQQQNDDQAPNTGDTQA